METARLPFRLLLRRHEVGIGAKALGVTNSEMSQRPLLGQFSRAVAFRSGAATARALEHGRLRAVGSRLLRTTRKLSKPLAGFEKGVSAAKILPKGAGVSFYPTNDVIGLIEIWCDDRS